MLILMNMIEWGETGVLLYAAYTNDCGRDGPYIIWMEECVLMTMLCVPGFYNLVVILVAH